MGKKLKENGTLPSAGDSKTLKTTRGGARPGAGRPKGMLWASTLDKLAAREETRKMITAALGPMIRAQIANATGIGHLYTRDKAGKFAKIENQDRVDELLAQGTRDTDYWIFTKDPSVQAFTDLVNRALDKAKEQEIDVNVRDLTNTLTDEQLKAKVALLASKL